MQSIDLISIQRALMLHPALEHAAIELLVECKKLDIDIRFTSTLRTRAEQNNLYEKGRSAPGSIVTWATGGSSFHNYGLAVDFCLLFDGGREVSWDLMKDLNQDGRSDWEQVVSIAKHLGFEAGMDWERRDCPHFQNTFGLSINECKYALKKSLVDKKGYILLP